MVLFLGFQNKPIIMKKQLLLVGVATILLSCTSPMQRNYSKESSKADLEAIKEELDPPSFMLLAGTLVRLEFEEVPLDTMTYAEILEHGKKWQAEQDRKRKSELGDRHDRRRNYPYY